MLASAILLTFIKLPFVINIFVLSTLVAVLYRFYCRIKLLYENEKLAHVKRLIRTKTSTKLLAHIILQLI